MQALASIVKLHSRLKGEVDLKTKDMVTSRDKDAKVDVEEMEKLSYATIVVEHNILHGSIGTNKRIKPAT